MRVSHISTAAATAFLYRNKTEKIVAREREKYLTAIMRLIQIEKRSSYMRLIW